ncbi:syndecan-4 isoform X2 [Haliaeetus albicilla]|uniref:syndecan-4 isoform X2 n=1 Tax=Haliaeetus albicilla TaxID=8969 RepID=UPI0037E70038
MRVVPGPDKTEEVVSFSISNKNCDVTPCLITAAMTYCERVVLFSVNVRETETMDARWLDYPASGDLPDDEDIGEFRPRLTSDGLDIDEASGSGDYSDSEDAIYLTTMDTPVVSDNYIPGDTERKIEGEKKNTMVDNEIIPDEAVPVKENLSNKISMASTANSSIFERTEVLTALIAGGAVGLLFAVFLILLLVYRMKKKDEGSYDLGKKPIYKKAPTNEFYA